MTSFYIINEALLILNLPPLYSGACFKHLDVCFFVSQYSLSLQNQSNIDIISFILSSKVFQKVNLGINIC